MTSPDNAPGPAERVRRAFRRIAASARPEVWITLRPEDDVLADALTVERRLGEGADLRLAGLLVAVKDNIDVAGLPTTAGCPAFAYHPTATAPAVRRLVDAGALILGKTNLDQFATGLVGTRSPYGAVRNAHHPALVSGGSSSGSAVAVALGIADIGVGTDTAGSGRVPAALNGIVGIKPTRGLVPLTGVVPAARPYDCVSVFASTVAGAQHALAVMSGPDGTDPDSRTWPPALRLSAGAHPRVAVPDASGLRAVTPAARKAFHATAETLRAAGMAVEQIDITPFLDAAALLYGSALAAERYAAVGGFISGHREQADPSVAAVILGARGYAAHELAAAQARLHDHRAQAHAALRGFDALVLPTTTRHPSLEEVAADPIDANSRLGTYTNFVNLLDMSAVAVPAGPADGTPFGVSVVTRAFEDQVAIDIAAAVTGETIAAAYPPAVAHLAVFGAHMRGEPLNHRLAALGARFLGEVRTAPRYRMLLLPASPPEPGMVVDPAAGASLHGERWAISAAGLGTLLAALPEPMTLGRLRLDSGESVVGFHCSEVAAEGCRDITAHGSWRRFQRAGAH